MSESWSILTLDYFPNKDHCSALCQLTKFYDDPVPIRYTRVSTLAFKIAFFDQLQEYDDVDLWHDLIDFSIDKPYFVHVLLHNIGTHVDPRILIERIENGREIPGLRDSLVQIMHDYQLQVIINF